MAYVIRDLTIGQEEIARFLVDKGALAGTRTSDDNTAADMAKIHEQFELASLAENMPQVAAIPGPIIIPNGESYPC